MAMDYNKLTPLPDNDKATKTKQQAEEERKAKKVVKGNVQVKIPFWRRLFREFIVTDGKTILSHLWKDEIVPDIKDSISNIARQSIDMAMYGESGGSKSRSGKPLVGSKVSYDKYYSDGGRRTGSTGTGASNNHRGVYDCDSFVFEDADDANKVLQDIFDEALEYGQVPVASFYDFAGVTHDNWALDGYGWKREQLEGLKVERVRGGGWVIPMPKPIVLPK